jgi:hypothetical protein
MRNRVNGGADPPVRGRPPGRPPLLGKSMIQDAEERVQRDPRGPGGPPHQDKQSI